MCEWSPPMPCPSTIVGQAMSTWQSSVPLGSNSDPNVLVLSGWTHHM